MGMNEMIADMLTKAIPPEVLAMLQPDNIKAFGDKATAYIDGVNAHFAEIKETLARLEEKIDAGTRSNSIRSRQRAPITDRGATGPDGGQ
jgi:hypothetical protein